jgi:hypothetical protein
MDLRTLTQIRAEPSGPPQPGQLAGARTRHHEPFTTDHVPSTVPTSCNRSSTRRAHALATRTADTESGITDEQAGAARATRGAGNTATAVVAGSDRHTTNTTPASDRPSGPANRRSHSNPPSDIDIHSPSARPARHALCDLCSRQRLSSVDGRTPDKQCRTTIRPQCRCTRLARYGAASSAVVAPTAGRYCTLTRLAADASCIAAHTDAAGAPAIPCPSVNRHAVDARYCRARGAGPAAGHNAHAMRPATTPATRAADNPSTASRPLRVAGIERPARSTRFVGHRCHPGSAACHGCRSLRASRRPRRIPRSSPVPDHCQAPGRSSANHRATPLTNPWQVVGNRPLRRVPPGSPGPVTAPGRG